MEATSSPLLSTGEAARLLGVSRQHVVDLCDRGVLPAIRVGTHRRIRQASIDTMLAQRLTRDQERSLWLHSAVAGILVREPQVTLDRARTNLAVLERTHPDGMAARWIARWRTILAQGVDEILETLTSRSPLAVELRQNSPFAGALPATERQRIAASFRAHWLHEHTT